jgi:RND superfamily putative drug exporter
MIKIIEILLYKNLKLILSSFILLTIAITPYSFSVFDKLNSGGYESSNSAFTKASKIEAENFPESSAELSIAFSYQDLNYQEGDFKKTFDEFQRNLKINFPNLLVITDISSKTFISTDNKSILILLSNINKDKSNLLNYLSNISKNNNGVELFYTSGEIVTNEINKLVKNDVTKIELFTIPIVLLLLVIFFNSFKIALTPIFVALLAIIFSFFTLAILSNYMDISIFAVNIITGLGLGLAVDYSMLIVKRFKEELDKNNFDSKISALFTLRSAGRTVIYSGAVVGFTLLSLLIFPINFLKSLGIAGAIVVFFSVISAIFPLIILLAIFGNKLKFKEKENKSIFFENLGKIVIRKPILFFTISSLFLISLLLPIKDASFSQADHRILPKNNKVLVDIEYISNNFNNNNDIKIIIDRNNNNLNDVEKVIATSKNNIVLSYDGSNNGYERYTLNTSYPSGDLKNISIVKELLNENKDIMVTGISAGILDSQRAIFDKLPYLILFISFFVFLIIMLFTGSIIIPIKAVILNFLSLGSMIGVLKLIFIDGRLDFLLSDFIKTGFLDLSSLVLASVVAFGLSMDYELFLLARIKEEYDSSKDNEKAIISGVANSAKIITTAALILAIAFGGFIFTSITSVMMLGIGIALTILIDATIIRAVLVPATMKLLGKYNWYAPEFIKNITLKH